MKNQTAAMAVSSEDIMRADLYALLGRLLFVAPDSEMLQGLQSLAGDDTEIGQAFSMMARFAGSIDQATVREEYDALFIGMGRGELLPYASYYLTGFLNEKPLAKLRQSMAAFGIARQDKVTEPEDHIGSLFEMMAGLIMGRYSVPAALSRQKQFFDGHIEPWAGHFFRDLEAAQHSRFYQPVGTIGRIFMQIEADAFAMDQDDPGGQG